MKKISDFLKYKSTDQLKTGVLYTYGSDPFEISDGMALTVNGICLIDGETVSDLSIHPKWYGTKQLELTENSSLMFHNVPKNVVFDPPEVEEPPEAPSTAEAEILQLFENWIVSKGIVSSEQLQELDLDDEPDDEYGMNAPLDETGLIEPLIEQTDTESTEVINDSDNNSEQDTSTPLNTESEVVDDSSASTSENTTQ